MVDEVAHEQLLFSVHQTADSVALYAARTPNKTLGRPLDSRDNEYVRVSETV
jgi:hypothetical protein